MTSLKNRLFKHKRKIITFIAVSLFIVSMYTPIFLSSQPSTNTNYLQTLLLNNLPINNNINAKDSWLSGWNCSKIHTITGSTAGALTNYQMRVVVHYGSGTDSGENVYCNYRCKADFGDVRFTKSDGTTQLNYWMESKTVGDKATFWVKVDYIPPSPDTAIIYIYYGNAVASTTSNGISTFEFFDDFNTLDTSVWNTTYCTYDPYKGWTIKNGAFQTYIGTRGKTVVWNVWQIIFTKNYYNLDNKAYEINVNMKEGGSLYSLTANRTQMSGIGLSFFTYGMAEERLYGRHQGANQWLRYSERDTIGFTKGTVFWNTGTWDGSATGYYTLGLRRNGNEIKLYENGVLQTTYIDKLTSGDVLLGVINDVAWYDNNGWGEQSTDWVRIRNLASPEPTHGAWGSEGYPHPWLSGWAYCKLHTIVGSSAVAQTNYQMRVTVHYGSGTDNAENVYCNAHCRYDFGDIRFTNSDGTTLLDYWMESKTDGDKATFWIEVDRIPASPSSVNIYVYYGKSDETTTSNGDNSFIFFDHFPSSNLDTNKWDVVGSPTLNVLNSIVNVSNSIASWGGIQSISSYGAYNIAWRCYGKLQESNYNGFGLGGGNCSPDDEGASFYWLTYSREYVRSINDGNTKATDIEMGTEAPNYHIFEITWTTGQNKFYTDGNLETIHTECIPDSARKVFAGVYQQASLEMDWVLLRKYCDPKPSHGAWGNEEGNASLIFTHEFESGNQLWDASSELGVELFLNLNNSVSLNMSRMVVGVGGGAPSGLAFLESFVSISVNDSSALQGINITIHYTDSKVAELGLNENSLTIWYWNETSLNWIQLPSIVDPINNTVTAYTTHLTNFAILGTFIPQGALLPYILLALFLLLMPSGLNPLVYLALGLVAFAVLSVLGLGLRSRREEQAAEVEALTRYERVPTSRRPAKYTLASTPRGSRESAPEQKMVLEVRKTTPEGETLPAAAPKLAKPTKTRRTAENLEAKRVALKDLMQEVNARFSAGKLTPDEYREIYTKYSTKLASIDKKLGRLKTITPVLGKWCCLFCGSEIQGNTKFCPNCGGARLKCSVCQTEIVTEEQYVKCPHCGVLSHKDHLFEWIKMRGACPNCNKKLSLQDVT